MESYQQPNAGNGSSRFSKALPVPPPKNDAGTRGKTNPFPTQNRALPAIPRRPVGRQGDMTVRSMRSASSMNSEYPNVYRESSNAMEIEKMPPLPPKHNVSRQLPEILQTGNHLHSSPISDTGSNPSSPQSELWRRRSVKSDRSVAISDLKLNKSNGSTATPSSVDLPSPPPKSNHPLPSLPTQSSRSVVGLPGRNIKKAVAAQEEPVPSDAMGSQISKASKARTRVVSSGMDKVKVTERSAQSQMSPVKRLPTPEYQSTDRYRQQLSPQLFSPTAPETPPSIASPELRLDPAFANEQSASLDHTKVVDDRTLLPSLRSRVKSEIVKVAAETVVTKSPQPRKPSTSSILEHKSALSLDAPSANALREPSTPDVVSLAAALSIVHFDCYQSHKLMRISRNDICPLECMVCEVKDLDKRWMCIWCSLRCCDPCMKGLAQISGKDLRKCLESIGRADRIIQRREAIVGI